MVYRKWLQLLVVSFTMVQFAQAESEVDYRKYWDRGDETNRQQIDHSQWDEILNRYIVAGQVSGIVQFRYAEVSSIDSQLINRYIDSLTRIDPRSYPRMEQKAYWMNLYNALSVRMVLENLSANDSFSFKKNPLPENVWSKKDVKVTGRKLSLDDIEHKILRPIWRDHRILFGLNCASMDCPNLSPRAYTAANISAQLNEAGQRFVNDDRGVFYQDGTIKASRLFRDFLTDFAPDEKTLKKVFAHYAKDMKALYLLGASGPITYTQDPRLNTP